MVEQNEVAIKFVLGFDNVEHALKSVDELFARKEKNHGIRAQSI